MTIDVKCSSKIVNLSLRIVFQYKYENAVNSRIGEGFKQFTTLIRPTLFYLFTFSYCSVINQLIWESLVVLARITTGSTLLSPDSVMPGNCASFASMGYLQMQRMAVNKNERCFVLFFPIKSD